MQNVIALSLKGRMRFHCQNNVQITWCSATFTHVTFILHTYIDVIIDASGNIHLHMAIVVYLSALTTTFLTGRSDHIPFTLALLAHCDVDKLTDDRWLNTPDFSTTITMRTQT